jgi:hypothetical protein
MQKKKSRLVSACSYICLRVLEYMCRGTPVCASACSYTCVPTLLYMCPYAIVTKYVCSYRCVGGDATTPREHLCDLLGGGLPQHLLGAATHAVCAGEGAGEAGAGEAARGGAREVGDGGLWGGPEALSFSSLSRDDQQGKKKENESPAGREGGVPPIPGAHALEGEYRVRLVRRGGGVEGETTSNLKREAAIKSFFNRRILQLQVARCVCLHFSLARSLALSLARAPSLSQSRCLSCQLRLLRVIVLSPLHTLSSNRHLLGTKRAHVVVSNGTCRDASRATRADSIIFPFWVTDFFFPVCRRGWPRRRRG